jgi:DNA-binding transcriptional ArsR family regulator
MCRWSWIRVLDNGNDHGPYRRRDRGAARGPCEGYDGVGASRWRALTASELAVAARITPQTASTHLAKLTEAGLLSMARHGRHRYFRFASPRVTDMIDGIVAVALEKRLRYRPLSRQARALNAARICYDHLAGRLSVDLTDSFVARGYVVLDDEVAEITRAGTRFLTEFGIELPTLRSTRRHYGRLCLDWTERRPHLAGAVGAAVTKRYFSAGWKG